jgi:carboxylesterase type B
MKTSLAVAGLLGLAHALVPNRRQEPSSYGAPTVTVKNGTIEGVRASTYNTDYFLGIPFAQPPVDGLRFRNPQSINTTFSGTYEAKEYAPTCFGYGGDQIGYPQSEDCLYLNVVRPVGYENQSLPVGVWIHASHRARTT